jgi:hypothetical protein
MARVRATPRRAIVSSDEEKLFRCLNCTFVFIRRTPSIAILNHPPINLSIDSRTIYFLRGFVKRPFLAGAISDRLQSRDRSFA